MKEYFTLEEAALIVRPERDGQLLPMPEAVKELLDIGIMVKATMWCGPTICLRSSN